MKVLVMSKRQFNDVMQKNNINDDTVEQFNEHNGIVFISINDTKRPTGFRPNWFSHDHPNVMTLEFDDVEHDGQPDAFGKSAKAFSESQSKMLYDFIKRNKGMRLCIVHCEAGISRSGAVGSFVQGFTGGDWEEFKRDNPHILPNARVLRMLNQQKYKDIK